MKTTLLITLAVAAFWLPLNMEFDADRERRLAEEKRRRMEEQWVDAKFNAMTEDQRIGQLFMIRAHSDKDAAYENTVAKLIEDYHVGGLCFFQGTPEKQVELTNRYQALATGIPLMISMDAEWGLGMRFKSDALSYPRQLMLGAIQDNTLIYQMGAQVARELRRIGTHINFAPVVDVNNNPDNPVINTRSFGEDRQNVTSKSYMYMKGMQDHQVMACAKHFPGHGDTDVDSHHDLPQILHGRQRLDSIEMYPFRVLAQHGMQSMMVAHLFIPAIDNVSNRPTTLSQKAIEGILKGEMGFDGLIFTDGLGMKGVTKHHKPGELEVKALQAGNDVLLLPQDTPAAFRGIKAAMADGTLSRERVYESVKKIIRAKYRLGLTDFTPIPKDNVRQEVAGSTSLIMKRKLIEGAITLVRNGGADLPFKDVRNRKFASLSIGAKQFTNFQRHLSKYADFKHLRTDRAVSNASAIVSQLKGYDEIIVSIHDMSGASKKGFGVSQGAVSIIGELQKIGNVTLVVFGNPYSLKYFDHVETLLECYEEDPITQSVAAQGIFGAIGISGRLPVTASERSEYGDGITTESLERLQYDIPESVGMDAKVLEQIDGIANEAITERATPGMQVLVAKDGKVVFHKSYGYHTRKKKRKLKDDDLFDVASITKVAATNLAVMKLYGEQKIDIYQGIGNYVSGAAGTNKADIPIRDILAHRGRLKAWIPFYQETLNKYKKPSSKYYKKKPKGKFTVKVADNLYMDENHIEQVHKTIYDSELRSSAGYRYSDLGFYLLAELVREVTGQTVDQYAEEHFYKPLGLRRTLFNPLRKFPKDEIVPTEIDKYFRHQKIQGYVHDMGAAMMGGVGGHAGLFSTGADMAIIGQMLLNGGHYGGRQFLNPNVIRQFTVRVPGCTRRGLGFDMRDTDPGVPADRLNVSLKCSYNTFGHTGFTGTALWVDPDHDLVVVFLSNRTYPSMNNYKFNKLDIRPRIQTVVYDSMRR